MHTQPLKIPNLNDAQCRVALVTQMTLRVRVCHSHGASMHALVLQTSQVLGDAVKLRHDLVKVGQQRDGSRLLSLAGQTHGSQGHILSPDTEPADGAPLALRGVDPPHELAQAVVAEDMTARKRVRGLVELHGPLVLTVFALRGVDVIQTAGPQTGLWARGTAAIPGAGAHEAGGALRGAL